MRQACVLVCVLAIVAAGCASGSTVPLDSALFDTSTTLVVPNSFVPTTEGDPQLPQDRTSTSASSTSGYEGPLSDLVDIVLAVLSDRLAIPASDITVVGAESMVWPNGALGCPQPDMAYTQALVEGTLIVLFADDNTYSFHSGGAREPFLCVP